MVDFKTIFLEEFEAGIQDGSIKSICDFGSGESKNFIPLLEKYPHLIYVGIEPSTFHAKRAQENLARFKNVFIYNASGYSCPLGEEERWGKFDLVISLSVLEHVKGIETFLAKSVEAAKPGGQVVHRYDLGHALYPSSLKERFQVFLGDHYRSLLPESKFVSGLRPSKVRLLLESFGAQVERETYHQMPSHKKFLKQIRARGGEGEEILREMVEWEAKASKLMEKWEEVERLKLFPAVTVWAKKV